MQNFKNLKQRWNQLCSFLPRKDRFAIFFSYAMFWLFLILWAPATIHLERILIDTKSWFIAKFINSSPSDRIIVAAIDTRTLKETNDPWPWTDNTWARIIDRLTQKYNPEIILIDVFFQARGNQFDQQMPEFAKSIKENGKVGLIGHFEESLSGSGSKLKMFLPMKTLRNSSLFWGFAQQQIDSDGIIRTFLISDPRMDKKHVSWELKNVLEKKKASGMDWNEAEKTLGLLRLRHQFNGYPRVSLIDISKEAVNPQILSGKILIIGATAPILHDFHKTSLAVIPGADILCSAVETVLSNQIQIFRPSVYLRLLAVATGLVIVCFLLSDFFKRTVSNFLFISTFSIFAMFALSFFSKMYLPFALLWLTIFFNYGTFLLFERVLHLNQIRESLHEAEVCGKLQQGLFPKEPLNHPLGISCYGKCVTYSEAGGDYFDYFRMKNGNIFFVLGDVSGHGISASIITSITKSLVLLKSHEESITITDLIQEINLSINLLTNKKMLMTMVMGIIDLERKIMEFTSIGHLPPVLRKGNEVIEYPIPGFPLGVTKKMRNLKLQEIPLPNTGFFLIYSDGIIESLNWKNQQFGFERFHKILQELPADINGGELIKYLFETMDTHTQGRSYGDDVTFLVLNFNNQESNHV